MPITTVRLSCWLRTFRACVAGYRGDYKVRPFSCLDHFLTLAEANERRDWRSYAEFAHELIAIARVLHAHDDLGLELTETVYALAQAGAFFVLRNRERPQHARVYSHPIDRMTGLRSDQTIRLTGPLTQHAYPGHLRRVSFVDETAPRIFTFLTNHASVPTLTIAALYKLRWQVELFFKWIKEHLRIQAFYGTSENAVETPIWTAMTVYVLVAIVKKRLQLPVPLYTILPILSMTLFEKTPLVQLLRNAATASPALADTNQLQLFDL